MTSYINFYLHFFSITYRFWNIWLQSFEGLTLTFRGPYFFYLTFFLTFLNVNVNVDWNKSVPHFFAPPSNEWSWVGFHSKLLRDNNVLYENFKT